MRKSQSEGEVWGAYRWERGNPEKSREKGPLRETVCSLKWESAESLSRQKVLKPETSIPELAPHGA